MSANRVCILDPQENFFVFEGEKTTGKSWHLQNDSQELKKISDQMAVYSGIFGCTENTLSVEKHFPGTLFRFPLRCNESPLSSTLYDKKRMESLFESFEKTGSLLLVFLKHIREVKLCVRSKDSADPECRYVVRIDPSCLNMMEKARQKFITKLAVNHGNCKEDLSTDYFLRVETIKFENGMETRKLHTFLINEYYKGENRSEHLEMLVRDQDLSCIPMAGCAFEIVHTEVGDSTVTINTEENNAPNDEPDGQIYCFLPLPVEQKSDSGLPVHVNGYFSLSQNRRHLKWPTAGQKVDGDKTLLWNNCLLTEVLHKSYSNLVLCAKRMHLKYPNIITVADIYKTMPNLLKVNEKWHPMLKPLYESLLAQAIFYSPAAGGSWHHLQDCWFDCIKEKPEMKQVIKDVMVDAAVSIVSTPLCVLHAIGAYSQQTPEVVTPAVVRSVLHGDSRVYTGLNAAKKLLLLQYLLKDEDFADLESIKLLPLANGDFGEFSRRGLSVFIPNDICPRSLLPGLGQQLITENLSEALHSKFGKIAREGKKLH